LTLRANRQVDDVDREIAGLKARGVEFEHDDTPGERSPSGAKAARFKDTEGNIRAIIASTKRG
jgi:hypothetical protein